MDRACTCFRIRRLSRVVAQLYDDALRPVGLRDTHLSLLSVLHAKDPLQVATLARRLGADTTSASRAIAVLQRWGWVREDAAFDARSRSIAITGAGEAVLTAAKPFWQAAQVRIARATGAAGKDMQDARLKAAFHAIIHR